MSNFKISKLEHLFVQELNKQLSQIPPLSIHKKLYESACNYAKEIITKKIKNFKGGANERRKNFPTAKRYREICFVSSLVSTSNSDDETSKILSTVILNNYTTDLKTGLNSIGPALVPLRSNKTLVIVFLAFFQPFVTVSKFNETFEPLSKQKVLPDDKSYLVDLFNRFRSLAHFDKLNTKPKKPDSFSFCFDKHHFQTTVSYSIQLFQRLMSDFKLYEILVDYWTAFSIETTPNPNISSQFTMTMLFWKYGSYLEYKVDVTVLQPKERKEASSLVSANPEDIVTRSQDIDLNEIKDDEQPIINELAESEIVRNRLNQQLKDLTEQAKRDQECANDAMAARDNFARQESAAYQEGKEARERQNQYEEEATKSISIAHQAEESLKQANKNAQEAEQKALKAAQEAASFQNDAEIQDAIYNESKQIKQEAEEKEKEAKEKAEEAFNVANIIKVQAQNQLDLAKENGDTEDVLAAIQNQEIIERKVDELYQVAREADEAANKEEEIIKKAESVAQEALQTENKLINEIQKQNQIQEEQEIIQETEASKIPEYSSIAEKAFEQAEIFENEAEKEAEIARRAEENEKRARKNKNAADLVAASLQRSLNYLESKAEVVEVAEEVFDAEASNKLDLEIDEMNSKSIENQMQVINDASYEPYVHDAATDKEYISAFDFIASNENEFVKDNFDNFNFCNVEAMEMLKAEKGNDTVIEEEEELLDENQIQDDSQSNFSIFEARDTEVNPVFDPESAKETELALNTEIPSHIQLEAAKELVESV